MYVKLTVINKIKNNRMCVGFVTDVGKLEMGSLLRSNI